jgi:NAD-dependent dihydropyrimidine dehydrogenase PreA subunit
MDVLRMDSTRQKAVVVYADDCHACFLCVFDCPREAIVVRGAEYDQTASALNALPTA